METYATDVTMFVLPTSSQHVLCYKSTVFFLSEKILNTKLSLEKKKVKLVGT